MALNGQKVVAVIEARMTSSRLPGKVLMPADGTPLLQILCERLQRVERLDEIVIATTINATDDPIADLAERTEVGLFRGSEEDVLQRVCDCLKKHQASICVEVSGDCPLVDPAIVDEALDAFSAKPDQIYISNSDPHRAVPAGLDVQIFLVSALHQLEDETLDPEDREHVTYGFYRESGRERWQPKFITHPATVGSEKLWVSLDHPEDYELIKALHEEVSVVKIDYGALEIIEWIHAHPYLHQRCLALRPDWTSK